MIAVTGWRFEDCDRMTFPRLRALNAAWRALPPVGMTLHRIGLWLGLPKPPEQRRARNMDEAIQEVADAGLPVMHGRPNDPMLALCGL